MATCPVNKIDSNVTGLRFAEEECLKQLPATGVIWYALEPNSYSDFGGQVSTVARNPINPSRQRKKGTVVDLDASGGLNQDLTQNDMTRLMQGFMFADIRQKGTTQPMNGAAVPITAVAAADKSYATTAVASFKTGHIIMASGFTNSQNTGLKTVVTSTAGKVTVTEAVVDEAAPPATAGLRVVGFQFPAADVDFAYTAGSYPRLIADTVDCTTLGLIPGEFVFLGGDLTASSFANNSGFARVNAVAATYIEFDKTDWTPVAEAGTGKTIQMFLGDVLKNENDPALIKRRSYQIERTLGNDADGPMSEVLVGAVANEFTLNSPQADKITTDLTFIACDDEQRTGADGLKAGARPAIIEADAFNTTSDFSRIKLASVSPVDSAVKPLFAFATDMTISINNNGSPNKALGVLGAFDTTAGTFEVGGNITAYFAGMEGPKAVRNNADITLDVCMAKNNAGIVLDVPLLSLGNGRLNVEQDQAITLPLDTAAAESKFGHTLLFQTFSYLPSKAEN